MRPLLYASILSALALSACQGGATTDKASPAKQSRDVESKPQPKPVAAPMVRDEKPVGAKAERGENDEDGGTAGEQEKAEPEDRPARADDEPEEPEEPDEVIEEPE